ncbi:thioesterase II family protein [Streptomyces sp. NEAU-Y11]|uniref:thioesterase II family protein n=1 Tax=Streptomyces cucumeris TaxID=2962890 RepID=UPI0020C8BB9E|nr:alpha/beta fold hydrolase [Streptomyces sp. NEAU-Y11]MCP9212500.1 alpha/beta fold hydrolase [Streptomyces sp. NEAU-Y11]
MGTTDDFGRWIRKLNSADTPKARLILLPHAGGSANSYFQFARGFAELDVHAVQYPGRQDRRHEPFRDTIEELADEIAELIGDWNDLPVVLMGNSMGALVAFEVTHRLEAKGKPPLALFACGRVAPTLRKDEGTHLKGNDAFLQEMALLGGMGHQLLQDEEILDIILPPMRADYRLAETYCASSATQVSVPVHVHIGRADPKVNEPEAAEWKRSTTGEFTLETHEGGHFFFTDNGARLTAAINGALNDTLAVNP